MWSYYVDNSFPDLREPPREIPLGFLFIVSSSALAKAAEPLDELVDMPFD
jgi:hypothetical protein